MIGSTKVSKMAGLYSENRETLSEIRRHILYSHCENQNFSASEYVAFRDGVASWEWFMERCLQETENPPGGDE